MNITILKDTEDPRPNRGGLLREGDKLTVVDNDLWRKLIKSKKATETKLHVTPIIRTVEEADNFNNENEE